MEISFIHMQILVHSHASKTNLHMKGFALGFALKQRERQLGNRLLLRREQSTQRRSISENMQNVFFSVVQITRSYEIEAP